MVSLDLSALDGLMLAGFPLSTLLVWSQKGVLIPVSASWIEKRIIALSDQVGIYFRRHDLRRTYGHRLHCAGVPIETIARLIRHETIIQSFRSYIGIFSTELRATQDRLCPS